MVPRCSSSTTLAYCGTRVLVLQSTSTAVVLERTKFSNSSAKFSNLSAKFSTSSTKFSDLSTKFSDSSTAIGKQVLWSQNPQNQNQLPFLFASK